ncbi:PMCA-type calcium-translocating P-type ATPase [Zychaea mexicana]|uniref:PMCA-type calcium-translocating P-type ATPase n=1 Tax=Zychaea mexicana TaxID=64656 RepID=UPI0022FF14DC|nr:PMCA-type calcium-translocating P-type ATPase [Zychaea mexicana]KAI9492376.1 PMCA-type calcium-translocating P-type ATPase [Zychaea mexicana]
MASDSNDKPPAIVTHPDELSSYRGAGGEPTLVGTATPSPVTSTVKTDQGEIKVDMREDLVTAHKDSDNPFAFKPSQLEALMDPKNLDLLIKYGGLEGVARGLHADIHAGLSPTTEISSSIPLDSIMNASTESSSFEAVNNIEQRTQVFGTNILPQIKGKSIFQLMFLAFRDKTLILLGVASIVSLAVGIYETIDIPEYDAEGNRIPGIKWVEGLVIICAIAIVVLVGSINDFQKDKQFRKLNAKKEDRQVKATRSGKTEMISVHDVQVGDVLYLEPGEVVSTDGIFIEGHNLKCDESAATGESDAVRKLDWRACAQKAYQLQEHHASSPEKDKSDYLAPPSPNKGAASSSSVGTASTRQEPPKAQLSRSTPDPFIISGSKVLEGVGTYLVTSVGVHSYHGRTMMALRTEDEMTPLQIKLNGLAGMITKLGSAAAILMLIALLIRYFVNFRHGVPTEATKIVSDVMSILILVVTVIVVAVPEGLPLAVTLALAYATRRMLQDNNLVRVLASCETMGNATTVCSDKTGTLTQNKMTVVAGTIGSSFRFRRDPSDSQTDVSDVSAVADKVPAPVNELIHQGIAINSSAFQGKDEAGNPAIVGNKTETALLSFTSETGSEHFGTLRQRFEIEQVFPFSSERKAMATIIKVPGEKPSQMIYRAHLKGASEIMVEHCSRVVSLDQGDHAQSRPLTEADRTRIDHIIQTYASQSLRTIAVAYREFTQWPPAGGTAAAGVEPDVPYEDLVQDRGLTLLGIIGIEDPLRPGVKDAVRACQQAGVFVRMVTGDNVMTAKSIARQCGIYTTGGLVMEGPVFRHLAPSEMDAVIPRLQVLARSSPEDKRILVERLKELGEIVAVTGDGTNDGPALKLADVGFSMGIAGTEVAKEASSIILMDDNFASIVRAIMWGRCVNDGVRKFLEFQLTVNVTAVVLTFISGVASEEQKSVLTAVQLLWVNLIMDTLAALALATDPPTEELLQRGPQPKSAPLISLQMWKMIIGQSIFQIIVTFVLLYGGILNYSPEDTVLQTIVFNTFVFCQIFNEINCRRIDRKLNVFHNIWANKFFIGVFFTCIFLQAIIVNFAGVAFQVTQIDGPSWAIAIIVGMFALPVGVVVRLIPDSAFGFLFRNPATRQRYLGGDYKGPLVPSIYMAGNDTYKNVEQDITAFKEGAEQHDGRRDSVAASIVIPSMVAAASSTGAVLNNNSSREKLQVDGENNDSNKH